MDPLDSLLQRPRSYYNVDGVGEMSAGFTLLGFAALGLLQVQSPQDAIWHRIYVVFVFIAAVLAISHYGGKAIKDHITYPRTGFVAYQKRVAFGRWILGALFGILTVVLIAFATKRHWRLGNSASWFGVLFAAAYARHFAMRVQWKWAVFCVLILGSLVFALFPDGQVSGTAWWLSFLCWGATLLVSGGISFWLYLRRTQASAQ